MDLVAKTCDIDALLWHSYFIVYSKMTHDGQYVVSINNGCIDVRGIKATVPEDVILRLENSGYITIEQTTGLYRIHKIPEKYVALSDIHIKEHEYKTLKEQFKPKDIDTAVQTFLNNSELPFTKDPFLRLFYMLTQTKVAS